MTNTFFDTDHLSIEEKDTLLRDSKDRCYEWWVDTLDCSISFSRQKTQMEFEDILKKLTNDCLFTIIHRKFIERHLEIGFCTLSGAPDYFLWIKCHESDIQYFVDKYKLKVK